MKKLYYCLLIIALYFLIQPAHFYMHAVAGDDIFFSFRHDPPESYQFLSAPFIEDQEGVTKSVVDRALAERITVEFFPYDSASLGLSPSRGEYAILFTTGHQERLHELPFAKTPSVEAFQNETRFYSSQRSYPDSAGFLLALTSKVSYFIGNLEHFPINFQYGRFIIMDSSPDQTERFLAGVEEDTGIRLDKMPAEDFSLSGSIFQKPVDRYLEIVKLSFRTPQILMLSTVAIGMVLIYLQEKKQWAIRRMMGYRLSDLFFLIAYKMIAPTVVVALITFIPFSLMYGFLFNRLLLRVFVAYLPLIAALSLVQMFVVLWMIVDLKMFSPLATLNREKHNVGMAVFAVAFKVLTLVLIIPLLAFHLLRTDGLLAFFRFQAEARKQYEDVWFLSLTPGAVSVDILDYEGRELDYTQPDNMKISWTKYFYDTIRDRYPVVFVYMSNPDDPTKYRRDEMLVNGNFIRLMQIRDENGKLLEPDNDEKMAIATEERYETAHAYITGARGISDYLSVKTTAFEPAGILEPDQVKMIKVLRPLKGTKVRTFQSDFYTEEAQHPIWLDHFTIVVNARVPNSVNDLRFIGISEAERGQLLKDVAHLPYADRLEWQSFREHQEIANESKMETAILAIQELGMALFCLALFSFFIYRLIFAWLSQRMAVEYLFGASYFTTTAPILLGLLSLDGAFFLLLRRRVFDDIYAYQKTHLVWRAVFIIVAFELIAYAIAHIVYSRQTLKNLRVRE
ncbi:MAG TPA: hypothetical protein PL100_08005 [Bacillota bacterium]|nr:hypothetical protein [Bacillota bacterium]HQC49437.1 hypothetical protein [Bacillota bacterium]